MNQNNLVGNTSDNLPTGQEGEKQKVQQPKENFFKDVIKFSLLALIIVVPVRIYIASPFIVSGASMDPAFETGHYLIVDQISYNFKEPERGEVIIFRYPKDPSKFFIKRIIALPGETITINAGVVVIESDLFPGGIILNEPYITHPKSDGMTLKLKEDEYFVMGDNRKESSDSRIWGPLQKDLIVGKAFLRLLPPSKVGILPEQAEY